MDVPGTLILTSRSLGRLLSPKFTFKNKKELIKMKKVYSNVGFYGESEIGKEFKAGCYKAPMRPVRWVEGSPYSSFNVAKKFDTKLQAALETPDPETMLPITKLGKYVVVFKTTADGLRYKWIPKSYKDIVEHPKYKDVPFKLSNGRVVTLKEVLDLHVRYVRAGKWDTADKLKAHLDEVIDKTSRCRIDKFNQARKDERAAELKAHRIEWAEAYDETVWKEHRDKLKKCEKSYGIPFTHEQVLDFGSETYAENPIVAWCDHIDEYYHGEYHGVSFKYGMVQSNQVQRYESVVHTVPKYRWLLKVIGLAKAFGVTPKWTEATYNGELRLCIYEKDAKELQQVVNWYAGNVELNELDYSDNTTLHHNNRVDELSISEYAYYVLKDDYASKDELVASGYAHLADLEVEAYDRLESKDFLCPLYASEEDEGEEVDEI